MSTHALFEIVGLAKAVPVVAAFKLTALIGMYQYRLFWLATPNRH